MDPLPMTGNEPDARGYFQSDEDFSKYKWVLFLMTYIHFLKFQSLDANAYRDLGGECTPIRTDECVIWRVLFAESAYSLAR